MAEIKALWTRKAETEQFYPQYKSEFLAWCYMKGIPPWNFFGPRKEENLNWIKNMETLISLTGFHGEKKDEIVWQKAAAEREEES
jgi:hypothetical protein